MEISSLVNWALLKASTSLFLNDKIMWRTKFYEASLKDEKLLNNIELVNKILKLIEEYVSFS